MQGTSVPLAAVYVIVMRWIQHDATTGQQVMENVSVKKDSGVQDVMASATASTMGLLFVIARMARAIAVWDGREQQMYHDGPAHLAILVLLVGFQQAHVIPSVTQRSLVMVMAFAEAMVCAFVILVGGMVPMELAQAVQLHIILPKTCGL